MPGSTTELNLQTAVDSDDNADYLTISLADSLRTLDALYNNVTGHTHSGAHQGGPIGSIPASAIPAGSITSAMIADGTITSADIADGTIQTADLALSAANGQPVSYSGIPTFSTTTLSTWLDTPITVTLASIGQWVRVAGFINWSHSAASGAGSFRLTIDGGAQVTLSIQHEPLAAGGLQVAFEFFAAPAAGSHTYTIQALNYSAGTLSLSTVANCYLCAQELKR